MTYLAAFAGAAGGVGAALLLTPLYWGAFKVWSWVRG